MDETHSTPHAKPFSQDPTRLSLALGFTTGIAILSTVGFFIMLAKFDGTKTSSKSGTVAAATDTVADPSAVAPSQPTGPVQLAEITKDDHVRGDFNAPVTVVEFSDIQCPFCQRFHPTMQQLVKEYPGKVRWVFKHFPLSSIHPNARPAALAAECANEQGKFWEFVDAAYQNQELLGADFYTKTAKSLGLNEKKFTKCIDDQKFANLVDADYNQGTAAGVNGTPTTYVNGQPLSGAVPYEQVKSLVDSVLAAK